MKRVVFVILAICFIPGYSFATKTTYIATDHRFDYVKLKEVKGSVAESRVMTHPVTIDEKGLRAALASIKLSRSYLIKKKVDTQNVFDEQAIDFLAPAMVRAFAQASPMEEVVISYLTKNPIFILRNDRLNIADVWVHDNELHIKFQKLFAKITGDVDKRGNEARAVARAKGLRVNLEIGAGQMMGAEDPDEIILDMNYNYVEKPKPKEEPVVGVTMGGKTVPLEEGPEAGKDKTVSTKKDVAAAAATPVEATSAPGDKTVKERLEELEELKKEGLIDKTEYKEKRKEILEDL